AGAKYAGYALDGSRPTPAGPASTTPGYLSWGGATKLMGTNGVPVNLQGTAHGGYVTTTTKCAVCHSVHRATGGGATAGAINNLFLTAGGGSCVQCHTAWGSTQAALLVEWANPTDNAGTAGGPHSSESCENCHLGGIHGTSTSKYWGMNAYMLGGTNDAQIAAELPFQDRTAAGQVGTGEALLDPASLTSVFTDGTGTGNKWFVNGSTVNITMGGIPGQAPGTPTGAGSLSPTEYAAARSLLTSFTCSRSGCHVNSVFGNIVWGQTYAREQMGRGTGFMMTSGHSTAPGANSNHANSTCGPCHPGNPSGGYRLVGAAATSPDGKSALQARAYGCDQCHDAVGAATNSTAFPHGNRAIKIYQWANGTKGASVYSAPTTIMASRGNIWMYAANMSSVIGDVNTLVDPSVTLIQGAVGPNAAGDPGNIVDAVCLKCHVPADMQSATGWGLTTPLMIGAGHHGVGYTPPATGGWAVGLNIKQINPYSGALIAGATAPSSGRDSNRWLYLWR
ncbi:MAG: hypothetical protein FWC54_03905, partial [Actinomycetia bacterium]|nr:hypothetical protein [Actinomycetes bacterium]